MKKRLTINNIIAIAEVDYNIFLTKDQAKKIYSSVEYFINVGGNESSLVHDAIREYISLHK